MKVKVVLVVEVRFVVFLWGGGVLLIDLFYF